MSFIYYFFESKMNKDFEADFNNIKYKIIRTIHVTRPRKGDNKPRDYKMSVNKYIDILSKAISKITSDKSTTNTWSDNGKNNAIVVSVEDDIIYIISAINNAVEDVSKLFNKSEHIIHL